MKKKRTFRNGCAGLVLLAVGVSGPRQARTGTPARTDGEPPVLSLAQAKEIARRNNYALRIAREKLKQSELLIDKAWVMVKPRWNATGTYTHHNEEIAFSYPNVSIGFDAQTCGGSWNPDLGFCVIGGDPPVAKRVFQRQDSFGMYSTLSQPLFYARAISSIHNAYNQRDLARIATANVEDYLVYSLEVAYYGALTARRYLDIARHAVELRRKHLQVAHSKYELGQTTRVTVLRAEIDVNRAEQDLKRAAHSLTLAKEAIRLLVNRQEDFTLVEPSPPGKPRDSRAAIIRQAHQQRRDLAAARLELAVAERLKQDAWFRFLPTLALTGMFRVADVKGYSDSYVSWSIGLALTVPLYDGGLRYAYLDEARSRIREARLRLEQTRQNITSEIRQNWLKMEMAEANLNKAHRAVELAREQVELAHTAFEAGTTTNLEVLDANHMLFTSEMNEASEELELQLAILRLTRSVRMFQPGTTAPITTGTPPVPDTGGADLPAATAPVLPGAAIDRVP